MQQSEEKNAKLLKTMKAAWTRIEALKTEKDQVRDVKYFRMQGFYLLN